MATQPSNDTRAQDGGRSRARRRIFYVSYDGIGEPLGRSQVLAYLFRLAPDHEITLISFEKPDADRAALGAELAGHGIAWRPQSYHRRPPVLSTALDIMAGVRALIGAARRHGRPDVVHVRSYVPALMALLARPLTAGKLLFDIRGFWADERVDGGIWPAGSWLYKFAKRCERWFFRDADAIVTLTHASIPQVREWTGPRAVPVVVIPTCVDLSRFSEVTPRMGLPHVTWCGSIGTWYRFDLAAPLAAALGYELDVVTRQTEAALAVLDGAEASVRSLPPAEVPRAMHTGDIGLCLCVPAFSKTASTPTRLGEHLAAGMPVIATRGVGDLEAIVTEHRVGVVLRGDDGDAVRAAATELRALLSDPGLPARCRQVARELFDVDAGARRYAELYDELAR